MARPNRSEERRAELIPVLAATFAELGYRRTTTAELAGRCGVGENILYRLWPDKRAMFAAAIEHVFARSEETWTRIGAEDQAEHSTAEHLLDYEARHHGEFGLYRILFAGLSETDDKELAASLRELYRRFQTFVQRQVEGHREGLATEELPDAALTAWAILGLGTVANIGRELGLLSARSRRRLLEEAGRRLLGDAAG